MVVMKIDDPYIIMLQDDRDNALALNRQLTWRVESLAQRITSQDEELQSASTIIHAMIADAAERHEQAQATIQRLREIIRNAYDVYIQSGATLDYTVYVALIATTRVDMEEVIAEMEAHHV